MSDPFALHSDYDLSEDRVIETDNNKIHIKVGDYGKWSVYFERGVLPPELKGVFTTATIAKKAVLAYLQKRNKPVVKDKELIKEK